MPSAFATLAAVRTVFTPKPKMRVLEIERDDRIVLDDQDVVGHAVKGAGSMWVPAQI